MHNFQNITQETMIEHKPIFNLQEIKILIHKRKYPSTILTTFSNSTHTLPNPICHFCPQPKTLWESPEQGDKEVSAC